MIVVVMDIIEQLTQGVTRLAGTHHHSQYPGITFDGLLPERAILNNDGRIIDESEDCGQFLRVLRVSLNYQDLGII